MDIYTLQQWLGHRQVETTARYLHLVRPDSTVAAREAALCPLRAHPHSSSLRRLLAPAAKARRMATARALLAVLAANPQACEDAAAFLKRVAGIEASTCPYCRQVRWLTIAVLNPAIQAEPGGASTAKTAERRPASQGANAPCWALP